MNGFLAVDGPVGEEGTKDRVQGGVRVEGICPVSGADPLSCYLSCYEFIRGNNEMKQEE